MDSVRDEYSAGATREARYHQCAHKHNLHPQRLRPISRDIPADAALSSGPGLATGMGPAFGSGGSFLGTAASTAAGVIGGGLLLNSIRSMFGDHAGLGGHERSALGSSSGSAADSALAQNDRDQDQDQDQDDQEQEDQDQDQDQDRSG